MKDGVTRLKDRLVAYLNVHSYSQVGGHNVFYVGVYIFQEIRTIAIYISTENPTFGQAPAASVSLSVTAGQNAFAERVGWAYFHLLHSKLKRLIQRLGPHVTVRLHQV